MAILVAQEIVSLVGLHEKPEYYRGRGAWVADLSGERIAKIYYQIQAEIGYKESREFVAMVRQIKFLSARKFLESLYALENNGWCFSEETQKRINESEEDYGSLTSVFKYSAELKNESEYIRNVFLANINEKYDWKLVYLEGLYHRENDFECDGDWDDNDDDAEYD